MWRTSELWVVTALSVFVLSILITVGGVRQKDFEDDARTTELLESFSQPDPLENDHPHKIRHHRHHHHHRRKPSSSHLDPSLPPHKIDMVPPPLSEDSLMIPLYPKNVSEATLLALRRLKRQYFSNYDDPYASQSSSGPPPKYYVTEDGSDWRDDGRGTEWSAPSPCSRVCGGGVSFQERICRDPLRPDGSCGDGGSKRFFSCNTHNCPQSDEDYRGEQCAAFNAVPFEGRYYKWIPYTKAANKCELNCMPEGERFYYRHKRQVIDGTRCDDENKQVCVDGKCLPVGCDNVLGSRAREDKCRKCGGDGVGCHTVQGTFDSNNNLQVGYNDVLLIPMGASNILVKEKKASNNYLAIRNTSNHYYLNGNWRIDFPRELSFASTIFHYERKPHSFFAPESIRSTGPISEPIYIVVLYQESNPGIEYEYSISDKDNQISLSTPGSYYWIYDDFTPCSASCGGGYQSRYVYCAKRTEESIEYVEEDLCDGTHRPPAQQLCNTSPCPLRWYTGSWEPCTAKCGSNETGVQYRTVFCEQSIQGSSALVEDESRCERELGTRPEHGRRCTGEVEGGICASWHIGEWSSCSNLCGDGVERRTVRCHAKKDNVTTVYEDSHCSEERPEDWKPCYLKPCEGVDWISGPWSGCKASADPCDDSLNPGESRQVYCSSAKGKVYGDEFCHEYRKPNSSRDCDGDDSSTEASEKGCQYAWFAMQWGECLLTSCTAADDASGQIKGSRKRLVFCGTISATSGSVTIVEDEDKCNETKKYEATQPCDIDEDFIRTECFEKSSWFTGPWSKCSKACGSGTRSRQVICMVGNDSTTDVKKCGEEGIVFASEDCTGEDCDSGATGDEMISVPKTTAPMTGSTPRTLIDGMEPGVDCEPDYEDEYYYNYDVEGSGETTTEGMPTTTEMDEMIISTSEGGSGEDEMGSAEELISGESTTTSSGDSELDDLGKSTTTGSDELISSSTPGSEPTSGSETTSSDLSTSTISYSTTTFSSTEESTTEDQTTTTEAMTTTTEELSTTTEELTTTTEEPTTTTEPPTTTTEEPTTTTEEPTTTTEEPTTTTEEPTTTTEMSSTTEDSTTTEGDTVTPGSTTEAMSTTTGTEGTTTEGPTETTGTGTEGTSTTMIPDGSGDEMSGSGEEESGSGSGEELMDIEEMSGSGDMENATTTSAPPTTLEQALTTEAKLPKCPPRVKPVELSKNCSTSEYGCCGNGIDIATGPFEAGCTNPKTCAETKFGCCSDNVTPAQGKLKARGCPMEDCEKSLFGCCPDGKKAAEGNDFLNCEKPCAETEFGCCLDEKTPKKGPKGIGCPKVKCEDTRWKCCPGPDKEIATGPNLEGCKEINKKNCTASFYSCCIDGITAALGENQEGCPEMPPCFTEPHGCCDDEVTSAHGPNKEGCCLSSQFGCCIDNIQAATGPNLQGCGCEKSPFGCCKDNTTAARGPGGDCGCKFSEHGCCEDGLSTANGTNFSGCPCSSFQFGCCPDGESVSKGPNDEGCGCEFSEHGCCSDGKTSALKKDEPCGCEFSKFSCCPNGQTEAKGEDFEGCEEIPIKPGDVCGLDKERGSCRNFTVKWFFDMEYGGCSRFWYGGCDGNQNKFGTQDECKAVCVEPEGRDACYLPQVPGPCEGYYPSWYYDPQREMCLQFVYGGCLGNNNRFATRETCENNCLMSDRIDACDQPKVPGPCKGNYTRYFFDKATKSCSEFGYSGCKGNNNNFLTGLECEQRCSQEGRVRAILEQCTQRPGEGRRTFSTLTRTSPKSLHPHHIQKMEFTPVCKGGADLIRYYYDVQAGTCLRFVYNGCSNSNSNMFVSRVQCLAVCANSSFSEPHPNLVGTGEWALPGNGIRNSCFLPRREGPCGEKLARWYYDTHEERCVPFYYSGCQGNGNRFPTLGECEKTCPAALLAENTCIQPPAVGDCSSYSERFYFDPYESRCKAFVYSGCGGNSNNFMLVDECRNKCERSYVPQPVVTQPSEFNTAHCFQMPSDPSACYGSDPATTQVKWYYDKHDGVCKQFRWYSDCDAHQRSSNRFATRQECENGCDQAQDLCTLPQVQGPCSGAFPQYFYDAETDACELFEFGGCQGNGNRFDTIVQCEQRCRKSPDQSGIDAGGQVHDPYQGRDPYARQDPYEGQPRPDPAETERQRAEDEERRRAEYYAEYERARQEEEERRRQAEEAARVGAPDPNAPTTVAPHIMQEEICSLPMEIGPCRASVPAFFYDARTRKCSAFIYGGCSGNANRFETEEMCERQCGQFRGEDVCRISQADPGPCRARIAKFYFNPTSRTCENFFYGGCSGNGNRFTSREECEQLCLSKNEIISANDTISGAAICRLTADPGPCVEGYKRFYFDYEQNTCIPFNYGGCGGNLNSFSSFDSCLAYCSRALQYEYRANEAPRSGRSRDPEDANANQDEGHGDDNSHAPENGGHADNEIGLEECADQLAYCKTLQCPYGVEKVEGDEEVGGCPVCECRDPCKNFPCMEDEQCAVDIVGTIAKPHVTHGRQVYGLSHQTSYRPVCRKQNKSGVCPNIWGGSSRIGICSQECGSDADCMAELKCCSNGCGTSCMLPQAEASPDARVPPPYSGQDGGGLNEQPARILSTLTDVEAEEGSLASLECLCRGNPIPQISWRFNNAEVSVDSGRFRALQDGSVLQIVGVYKRDEGVYTCTADNGVGRPASLDITLVVTDPTAHQASIVEQDTEPNVIVSLGSAASLRCFAMGWPRPSVTWWKGEKMLPFSSERYEQMRDYSLLIRLVSLRDLGPYTCQAYNGQGKAASWTVTVQTMGPVSTSPTGEDREYLQYVISGARRPIYVGGNFTGGRRPGGQQPYSPLRPIPTTTTTTQRSNIPNYLVPLRTQIKMEKTLYPVGNDIVIPCEVEGYPQPSVHWYHEGIPVEGGERVRIFNQNELRIYNSTTEDGGSYRCDAVNEYGSSSSSVTIQVEGVYLHPNCTDNPFFANCKLIVKANYCTNKYYARFCCKSCTMAGQLPAYGPHLHEFGQGYFRRGQVEYAPTNLQSDRTSNSRGIHNQVS